MPVGGAGLVNAVISWALIIVLPVLVFDIIARLIAVRLILPIFERMPHFNVVPRSPDPEAEDLDFEGEGGQRIRGALWRTSSAIPRGVIVFCPEHGGSYWDAGFYTEGLRAQGYHVLSFGFRAHGESDEIPGYKPLHWLTRYEVADTISAVDYVESRLDLNHLPIGLMGVSQGGGAALVAAATSRQVRAVALDSVFSTQGMMLHFTLRWASLYVPSWVIRLIPRWHFNGTLKLVRWVSERRRHCRYVDLESYLSPLRGKRVQFISGSRDTYVPTEIAEQLQVQIGAPAASLLVIEQARHNEGRNIDPQRYDGALEELFLSMSSRSVSGEGAFAKEQPSRVNELAGPRAKSNVLVDAALYATQQ